MIGTRRAGRSPIRFGERAAHDAHARRGSSAGARTRAGAKPMVRARARRDAALPVDRLSNALHGTGDRRPRNVLGLSVVSRRTTRAVHALAPVAAGGVGASSGRPARARHRPVRQLAAARGRRALRQRLAIPKPRGSARALVGAGECVPAAFAQVRTATARRGHVRRAARSSPGQRCGGISWQRRRASRRS